jgi:DNA-binding beta-propeller fold protein YncE
MTRHHHPFPAVALVILLGAILLAQQSQPVAIKSSPLVLTGAIPLPGVQGRIDHLAIDPKGRLFISALGNNSVEVLDLAGGIRAHSIAGIPKPQGVAYAPEFKKLFVGSDEGKLYVYDGDTYSITTSIDFGDDVDNLRYDEASKRLYIGYGVEATGAIAILDAATNARLPKDFKLGAHPESFQLAHDGPNIYVNVPDLKQVAVINRDTGSITRWPLTLEGNFPIALDELDHRLFVVTRAPARLVVFDTSTGHLMTSLPCVQNSDDAYFDASRKRIYVAGGEGFIDVFQQSDPQRYERIARVPSALGARTAGYFGKGHKGFEVFYSVVPARADKSAEVLLYTVQD